jgi:serine/threonine protein kinase
MRTNSLRATTSSGVPEQWLASNRRIAIEGIELLPQENTLFKGNPLIVARGQAQAFYLHDKSGRVWILKKFLPGRNPDVRYIEAIQSLIPEYSGFESGNQRRVLTHASVAASSSASSDFLSWIENTILMPKVQGSDWARIADRVRDGTINLTLEQRLLLCKNLSEKIRLLEMHNLSHRDLSSTNIFIDTNTWDLHLIDWDSLYHPTLTCPPNTTFGTNGYVAPFVKMNGVEDPQLSWTHGADRFSLAVLNVEFLSVDRDSPLTGDGGLLDQEEIYNLGGSGLNKLYAGLQQDFPAAYVLFERALHATSFGHCPGPEEWRQLGAGIEAPSLKDVYDPQADFVRFLELIQKQKPPIPAPKLSEMEAPNVGEYLAAARKEVGPPAPRLSELDRVDFSDLLARTRVENVPAAPSLAELDGPVRNVAPAVSTYQVPAAPRLADLEESTSDNEQGTVGTR